MPELGEVSLFTKDLSPLGFMLNIILLTIMKLCFKVMWRLLGLFVARIDPRRCIGCGNCIKACFNHAIEIILEKAVVLDSQCRGCLICRTSCPRGAISATSRFTQKSDDEKLRIRAAVIRRQLKSIEERLKSISRWELYPKRGCDPVNDCTNILKPSSPEISYTVRTYPILALQLVSPVIWLLFWDNSRSDCFSLLKVSSE